MSAGAVADKEMGLKAGDSLLEMVSGQGHAPLETPCDSTSNNLQLALQKDRQGKLSSEHWS